MACAGPKSDYTENCGTGSGHVPMTSPVIRCSTSGLSQRNDDVMQPPPSSHRPTSAFYGQ